ncbi:MAG: hypothetical protein KAQ92_01370 [Candidatus Aenigmarchaeota archaeon]|nr:hypothetical protein [Candidatus Aenigmarchaeota archaeon]
MIQDLKKTYYHNNEIEPVEKRIKIKLQVAEEKLNKALELWEEKNYNNSILVYKELMKYFPTYKPAYLHYALAFESIENYNEAYDSLNIYYKLYNLYPDRNPLIKKAELKKMLRLLKLSSIMG